MKQLPWASWKFWNRAPASPKRVHLGIDYGTSVSKIVFRDGASAGGESAVLALRNGSFRIPSRVCRTTTELLFGRDTNSAAGCGEAAGPKARILLVDFWTNPTHTDPLFAALVAGEFLVIAGNGDVYSVEEGRAWLEQTGWQFVEHRPLAGPASLVVAEA